MQVINLIGFRRKHEQVQNRDEIKIEQNFVTLMPYPNAMTINTNCDNMHHELHSKRHWSAAGRQDMAQP